MLATVYLIVTSLAGFAVATRALPDAPTTVRASAGPLLAIVFTSWTTYLVAAGLAGATADSLTIGIIVSTVLAAIVLGVFGRSLRRRHLKVPFIDVAVGGFGAVLSWWLMMAHLREERGELLVSANTWGDMGLHIALARSFSVGANYPTEYPFFANEPIRYHFGFDFFAGMLQEGGLSVLWSFNVPGIFGFTALMLIVFALARLLFSPAQPRRWWRDRGVWVGFVAVAVLMTNQSFAWRRFITKDGKGSLLDSLDPSLFWNHKDYLGTGPYTDDRIAMFNTLNVYLTQTHLIIAMALVMLLVYVTIWLLRDGDELDKRLLIGVGVVFGVSFWLNGVIWLATAVLLGMLLVIWAVAGIRRAVKEAEKSERKAAARSKAVTWVKILACFVVPALALGVPQALLLNGGGTEGGLSTHLGYLVCGSTKSSCHGGPMDPLSASDWWSFVQYWWLNEAVFIPLLVLAFFLGNRRDKKIIGAVTCVFLWGSIFYVGQDVGGQNHKVFNLWENLGGLFVGFALVQIWVAGVRLLSDGSIQKHLAALGTLAVASTLSFLLVLSGLIDFMTIKNDFRVDVFGNQQQRQAMDWIVKRTPARSTFLTDFDQLYTAPTMGGRGVALGYSSWAGAAGYDMEPRKKLIIDTYTAPDRATVCSLLTKTELDYVLIGPQERTSPRFKVNEAAFSEMKLAAIFGDGENQYRIYAIAENC